MATPTQCTIYTTKPSSSPGTRRSPNRNRPRSSASNPARTAAACPGQVRPFNPSLVAGTSNPDAGAFSSFTLKLDREDGDQFLGKLNFTMPPGLTANLHGITYCPEAAIAAAAQTARAHGAGQSRAARPPRRSAPRTSPRARAPIPSTRSARSTWPGPFQGAPLSLVAITPALAGPYDYGTVVVRVALHIDPLDAHVIADSETVPAIIGGIPIRMRSIQVNIDKPNFMINPTNCGPFSVDSQGIGDQGTVAELLLALPGGQLLLAAVRAEDDDHAARRPQGDPPQPGSRRCNSTSRTRPGDANIKSVAVTLPKAFEIDQRHLGNICSRAQLAAEHCAGRQPIGTAVDRNPAPRTAPQRALPTRSRASASLPHVVFILGGQVTVMPRSRIRPR